MQVQIKEDLQSDLLLFTVTDNGCGMDDELLSKVRDPFTTTARKATGLGLSFLCQAAEQTGGEVEIRSQVGEGTCVETRFGHSHWDRAPLGNLPDSITMFFTMNIRLQFSHIVIDREGKVVWSIEIDSDEFRDIAMDAGILADIRSYLQEQYEQRKEWVDL